MRMGRCAFRRGRGVDTHGRGGQAHFVGVFVRPWRSRHAPRARSTGKGGQSRSRGETPFPVAHEEGD